MKDRKLLKYLLACIIPLVILAGITIIPLYTLFFGKEIVIETQPVDPRDVFMGDYVNLSYKIENVETDKLPKEIKATKKAEKYYNDTYEYYDISSVKDKDIYAVLKPEGEYYVVDYLTLQKPQSDTFIKCKLYNSYVSKNFEIDKYTMRVSYNLDKYYVPEGSGGKLEVAARKGALAATVKVFNGNAILKDVNFK